MRIKTDDVVIVQHGKYRDKKGSVIKADHEKGLVTVEGVNEVFRHVRRSQRNMQGGRVAKCMPIPISNVKLVCPSCQKPCRVGYAFDDDGNKYRVCKQCGSPIPDMKPKK